MPSLSGFEQNRVIAFPDPRRFPRTTEDFIKICTLTPALGVDYGHACFHRRIIPFSSCTVRYSVSFHRWACLWDYLSIRIMIIHTSQFRSWGFLPGSFYIRGLPGLADHCSEVYKVSSSCSKLSPMQNIMDSLVSYLSLL